MRKTLSTLTAVVLGVSFLWHATDGVFALTTEAARRHQVALSKPKIPNVRVETMTGDFKFLIDHTKPVTVVEFIYTTCPYICQADGAQLAQLRDVLKRNELENSVNILSISFDPQTDQVEELANYGKLHKADGKTWTVARPESEHVEELLTAFGITVIPDDYGGYQHNSALHLVNQQNQLVAILDTDDLDGALKNIGMLVK